MIKIIKISFLSFLIYAIFSSLYSIILGEISLKWPDKTLVAPILYLKGILQNDFHTLGYINTPVLNTANIFSIFLPIDNKIINSIFTNFTILQRGYILVISIYLISTYTLLLINNFKNLKKQIIQNQHILIFIILLLLYTLIKTNIFSNELFSLIFGGKLAGVHLFDDASHSRYISLSFAITSISIPLTFELYKFNGNKKTKNKITIASLIIFLISIYFHPVAPIFILPIGIGIPLILGNNKKLILNWWKLIFSKFCVWFISVILTILAFPQKIIDSNTFFKIYIQDRHPHHYLVSDYLSSRYSLFFISINIFILAFIIYQQLKNKESFTITAKNISLGLIILFCVHITQFITVDVLKVSLFMKLGLSWLTILFNFYYVSSLTMFFCEIFIKSKVLNPSFVNKYLNNQKLNDNLLNFSIFILTTISLFILNVNYKTNIEFINNSIEYQIGEIARTNNIDKDFQYIASNELKDELFNLREFGNLNVYSDKYFPFNTNFFNEWYERKANNEKLFDCLKKEDSNLCTINKKNLIYLSNKKVPKLGDPLIQESINIKNLSLYCKIKKTDYCFSSKDIFFTQINQK